MCVCVCVCVFVFVANGLNFGFVLNEVVTLCDLAPCGGWNLSRDFVGFACFWFVL